MREAIKEASQAEHSEDATAKTRTKKRKSDVPEKKDKKKTKKRKSDVLEKEEKKKTKKRKAHKVWVEGDNLLSVRCHGVANV